MPSSIRSNFCIFCNQRTKRKLVFREGGFYFVRCFECGAMGPLRCDENNAIKAWNEHHAKRKPNSIPAEIRLAKLPLIMQDVIGYMMKNQGVLFRHHGTSWANQDWKKGEYCFGTLTIKALVFRDFVGYSAFKLSDGKNIPVEARLLKPQ